MDFRELLELLKTVVCYVLIVLVLFTLPYGLDYIANHFN